MGLANTSAISPLPFGRLVGVGLIVFIANAAMLVLQLVSNRLLAPFIGSSLETWTSVIGVFLVGIALGNAYGGRLADRYPSPRTLSVLLALGAIAALWMAVFSILLTDSGVYKSIPLGPRIPVLAAVLCLPAGFILSLLTPLAIKLGLPDLSKTGRVAGMVFALSTLGCLLGNYFTGFYLIPSYTINTLVYAAAGTLAALSIGSLLLQSNRPSSSTPTPRSTLLETVEQVSGLTQTQTLPRPAFGNNNSSGSPYVFTDIRLAYLIVFLASFGGMTLELTASRVLAQFLGVSLFTWTGIIGVMLAGTALGNFTGGLIADRANQPGSTINPRYVLAGSLLIAAAGSVFHLAMMSLLTRYGTFETFDPILRVNYCTFCLFFLPMFALGTISPQVIRLAVPDVAHIGRVAGRVYAWSTTGAILGTFVAGYLLLSLIGMNPTILLISLILTLTSLLVAKIWNYNLLLYMFSVVLGGITGGLILILLKTNHPDYVAQTETNYYTIKVIEERNFNNELTTKRTLYLDLLLHSTVDTEDPFFFHYTHEYIQMEFVRAARQKDAHPRVLVVGGGGYTFPRYAMEAMPEAEMDVVEIDPGVTSTAKKHLGLKDYEGLKIHHMDGRQFITEKVPPGTYDLVVQDAVNDLSVPSHLMTKEYNDAIKTALKPNGVYLLTVIDSIGFGMLWKAAMHTLQQTYPPENIALLTPDMLDPTRFKISNSLFPTGFKPNRESNLMRNSPLPESVLSKLEVLRGREFSQDEFRAELASLLDEGEREKYQDLILEGATSLFYRQVLVIYASDHPVDLDSLRTAVADQLNPIVTPGFEFGTVAGGLAVSEVLPHSWATLSQGQKLSAKGDIIHTYRIPAVNLQPYLDAPPHILLTDQFAPVDNLMADVFRYRNRIKPKK